MDMDRILSDINRLQFNEPEVAYVLKNILQLCAKQQQEITSLQSRVAELSILADPLAPTEEKTVVAQKLAAEGEEKRRLEEIHQANLSQFR